MLNCYEMDTMLEAYVNGDLALDQNQGIRDHVDSCPDCRLKLEFTKRLADELHSLPRQPCPDTVVQNVFAQIQPKRTSILDWLRTPFSQLKPRYALGFSVGFALVLVAFISISVYHPSLIFKDQQSHYTEEQIAQAKKDIYLALGYVNYATSRTQQIIEKEVVPKKVIRPIQKSLDAIHTSKEKGDAS